MKGQRVDVTHALSKLRSGQATQFIIGTIPYYRMSHGQKLSSTSGEPEFVAQ
jgi:hypothetical protein